MMNTERLGQLELFLAQSPNDPFLIYAIATEYVSGGNDSEAELYFQQLVELHPDYIGTYYHFAKLLERQSRIAEAIKMYKAGLIQAANKGDKHAWGELKTALSLIDDEDE
jgi:tetratricopeptide (TPR) repeat protein